MISEELYLKPNVVIEPLVDRWYAWPHLISPATFAKNLTGRHLKIMDSYIDAPKFHAQAVQNPDLLGGPFMDFPEDRSCSIKELRNETVNKRNKTIALSEAITQLDQLLQNEAKGYSLDALYEKVPEELRGYVELVYDLHHNPDFRFFESLLYRSEYYAEDAQSIAIWITENDERPFSLSTPKLDSSDVLHVDIPFSSDRIDQLSALKRKSSNRDRIAQLLDIDADSPFIDQFFTQEKPRPYEPYEGDKIRMRYFGHACVLLETSSFSILVDPLMSYYGYFSDVARFSDFDLPDVIDYVLITHNHQDHILFETLLPLRHKIKNLVIPKTKSDSLQDPSLLLMFKQLGFDNVIEIEEMDAIQFDDCEITGVPFIGEHCDLDIRSKTCHHVKVGEFSLLLVADSCNIEPKLYEHVHRTLGDVDVILLGMECDGAPISWLYGPLYSEALPRELDHSRKLSGSNYMQGRALVEAFNPREVYVYAMGQEPWTKFISTKDYTDDSLPIIESNKLLNYCEALDITAERLFGERELFYDKEMKLSKVLI